MCQGAAPNVSHGYAAMPVYWCCCRFVAGGNAGDAADQLKQLIRELHRAGLEVLLEVRGPCRITNRFFSTDRKQSSYD